MIPIAARYWRLNRRGRRVAPPWRQGYPCARDLAPGAKTRSIGLGARSGDQALALPQTGDEPAVVGVATGIDIDPQTMAPAAPESADIFVAIG